MEQTEVEKLIGELETALDRLRALYEQYFVGMERIEPAVPRKDVERRLYVLRKEQIRNTALRYRFQMVLQKYNTYQTHWQRVCREIENGTYKRHLMRAQRRFGSSRPPRGRASVRPPEFRPEPGAPLPQDLVAELARLDEDFGPASVDVDVSFDDQPSSSRPRPPLAPSPPIAPALPSLSALSAPAAPRPVGPGGAPAWKKVAAPGAPPAPAPAPPPPQRAVAASSPQGPKASPPAARPLAPGAPPAPRPAAPAPPIPAQWPPRPAAAPSASTAQPRAQPAPPARSPGPSLAAAPPVAPAPRGTAQGLPPAPAAGPAPIRPVPAAPVTPAGRPPALRPSPSSPPQRPPSFPTPRPPPGSAELSEKRLRQIYVEYVDAKRRQNESTAAITFQSVAKSLRESGDRLRQKHGKDVDFEVAVKDGKTVLRPVLK